MSLDKQKSLETMRTFARDVEREKGKSDEAKQALADLPANEGSVDERSHTAAPVSKGKKGPVIKADPKPPQKDGSRDTEEKREEKKRSAEPEHIPAFHELQKTKKTNIKARPEKPKEETKKDTSIGGKKKPVITSGGTVITDNKKSKKSFFGELQKSITAWFDGLKKSLKPKKNTYSVSKTERRKGVVQKATSKTGTIFTADSETLREQIKARQRAEKHERDDEDLTWSPYTEPGYPLLEGEETESNDPRVLKVSVTPKTHSVPKPVIKSAGKIAELQEEKEEPSEEELEALEAANKKVAEESAAKEEAEKKEAQPEPKPEVTPEPEEATPEQPPVEENGPDNQDSDSSDMDESNEEEEEPEDWNLEDVDFKDTNTLAMLIVGVFLALGIFGFVLFGIFGFGSNETEMTDIAEKPVAIYQDASLNELVIFNLSFNELVGRINTTLVDTPNDRTTEYVFVNRNSHPVPGNVLMETIRTIEDDGFVDTVSAVRFIETSSGERALMMSTSDKTMTVGGMLNWEDSLFADVGSILDIQNNVPPSAGEFIDQSVGSLDTRSLVFDSNTLLIYAVVNETDVIIASDQSLLTPYSE